MKFRLNCEECESPMICLFSQPRKTGGRYRFWKCKDCGNTDSTRGKNPIREPVMVDVIKAYELTGSLKETGRMLNKGTRWVCKILDEIEYPRIQNGGDRKSQVKNLKENPYVKQV